MNEKLMVAAIAGWVAGMMIGSLRTDTARAQRDDAVRELRLAIAARDRCESGIVITDP